VGLAETKNQLGR